MANPGPFRLTVCTVVLPSPSTGRPRPAGALTALVLVLQFLLCRAICPEAERDSWPWEVPSREGHSMAVSLQPMGFLRPHWGTLPAHTTWLFVVSQGRQRNSSPAWALHRCHLSPVCGCLVKWPFTVPSQPLLPRTQTSTRAG